MCIWNHFRLTREDGLIVSGFRRPVVPPVFLGADIQGAVDACPAASVSISSRVYDQVGRKAFGLVRVHA